MCFQKHKPKIKTHRPSKNFHVTLFYEDLESELNQQESPAKKLTFFSTYICNSLKKYVSIKQKYLGSNQAGLMGTGLYHTVMIRWKL